MKWKQQMRTPLMWSTAGAVDVDGDDECRPDRRWLAHARTPMRSDGAAGGVAAAVAAAAVAVGDDGADDVQQSMMTTTPMTVAEVAAATQRHPDTRHPVPAAGLATRPTMIHQSMSPYRQRTL